MNPEQDLINEIAKRAIDVAVAGVAIVLSAPLWLGVAAMIKLASPGPVLFVQERIGRHRRPFRLYKFRTMHLRSEAAAGSSVTTRDDPRIFRGAGWLRRTKLDELPQLLNVLVGSMSLVGPRPTVQADYDRMTHDQCRRADALPGITGWAQIRGGAEVPWPVRLRWDLQYVEQRNIALDLRIMVETAWLMVRGRAPGEAATSDEWSMEAAAEP